MLGIFRARRNNFFNPYLRSNYRSSTTAKIPLLSSVHARCYSETGSLPVTKIEKIILDTIKATGPISFAMYMQLCLSHPTEGYYMNPANSIFGSRGDFTTSPEISQVFGELVGIWLLSQWMKAGQPPSIRLIELGPGRGTLMDDILRVISQITASKSALQRVHLVETSPAMRSLQKSKLLPSSETEGWRLLWHDSIDDVPLESGEYTMLVAHEFFDALPIHILEKTSQGWREVLIASTTPAPQDTINTTINGTCPPPSTASPSHNRLRRVLSPTPTPASILHEFSSPRFRALPVGTRMEVSPTAFKTARKVGQLLSSPGGQETKPGGSALIVDYGGTKVYGDSFRAFKNQKIVDVFHRPGQCDLTANVDFAYLKEAIADLAIFHGLLPQYCFLDRMGIELRVEALVRAAPAQERKDAIREAAKRLVDRIGMGREYQVFGITSMDKPVSDSEGVWPFVGVGEGNSSASQA